LISRSLRTFWAVRPPHPVLELLAGFVDELKTSCAQLGIKVAWLAPQSMHITLKLLGQVEESTLPAMLQRVQRGLSELAPAAAAPLFLHGMSAFPDVRQPRVLFVDVRGAAAGLHRLAELQRSLQDWLAELGFAREARPFHPHLTLGRVRDGGAGRAAKDFSSLFHHHGERRLGEAFPIEEVILYESRLDGDGATYVPLHTLPLDGQPKENVGHGN
jgi:2'-5' RNA ligase